MSAPADVLVVAAAIFHEDKCLIARRKPGGSYGGCWEFPGGKIEAGETPQEALRREIEEELALEVQIGACLGTSTTPGSQSTIVLSVFAATPVVSPPKPVQRDHDALVFIGDDEFGRFRFADPDIPLLIPVRAALQWRMSSPQRKQ